MVHNLNLPIDFKLDVHTVNNNTVIHVTMLLGGMLIQNFTYYGNSEAQAVKSAKTYLKDLLNKDKA